MTTKLKTRHVVLDDRSSAALETVRAVLAQRGVRTSLSDAIRYSALQTAGALALER